MTMTKTALITGAAGGLGAALADRMVEDGYRVALLDRDGAAIKDKARSLPGTLAFAADVTDEAQIDAVVAMVAEAFDGAPDVLVNNAGIVRFGDILEQSVSDFRQVVDVNLVGTYIMSRAVGRLMVARGSGAIINITSLNAVAPSPDAGAYPASKAAVAVLTQHLALALGPRGVRVNAIAPGFIDAGMSAPIYTDQRIRDARGATVPAGRIGTADDVANAVLFLASDRAGYIMGQHLMVDGGVSFSLKLQMPRKAPTARR
jgi:NAD(P)-dependent dehydrogenase (short-subunit alcohol dehydrogenase family)